MATGKNRHEVEVAVDDTQTLHEFTGVLADAGVTVTDIETTQLDFSEVYLRLTSDEGRPDSDEELSDDEGQSGSAGRPEGSINRDDDDDRTERDIDRDDADRTERDIDRDDADRTEGSVDA